MKKNTTVVAALLFCCLFNIVAKAQIGVINTWANIGGHTACNVAVDAAGNVYAADGSSHVYRIDSGGALHNVAGGGSSYGDGGPATAAKLITPTNVDFDISGNMYISDRGNGTIRMVNTSGVITTVAGNNSAGAGYTGDGGAATAARVNPYYVHVDASGNIYIADGTNKVIRKVNTAGTITTVAGNGSTGFSGDGGPATAASFSYYSEEEIWGMTTDAAGNLYVSDANNRRIRKIDASGIITTVAGTGGTGYCGVGGPASAACIYYPQGMTTDAAGNLYIAQWQNCVLEAINVGGILNTVSGNYSISFSGDGGAATAAGMNAVSDVAIDHLGNIYIADCHNGRIRKVTGSFLAATHASDSFGIFVNKLCSGPVLSIATQTFVSGYSVKCIYGDGTTDSGAISMGFGTGGYATFTHNYSLPGTYTIRALLCNGSAILDTLTFSYEYKLCNTISMQYYHDANSNCTFDTGDSYFSLLPVLTEIDSNGVPVDTISSMSGIYYTAYGSVGDVYSFKVISAPAGMHVNCPSTGIVNDTLGTGAYSAPVKTMGFECNTLSNYDLTINAVVPVTGVRDQWGDIYVRNLHCAPTTATITLHYDKHYKAVVGSGSPTARPTPSSYTDSTITWNLSSLSAAYDTTPVDIWYAIWTNPDSGIVPGYPAKSYYTVTPTSGDADTTDNVQVRVDTVRGGCDPNHMEVSPEGYIPSGIRLRYTATFTNTGNDTTYNIYVMDTLSDYLDISSMRVEMASANMNITKLRSGGHNILKFDFPEVNLLDSIRHPDACTESFVFSIDTRSGLPDGTHILNRAGIFFDYNPVVLTNFAENIIGIAPDAVPTLFSNFSDVRLYPNPVNSKLFIDGLSSQANYVISDIVGVTIQAGQLRQGTNILNIEALTKGLYFIKFGGAEARKFVKQ